MLLVYLMSLIPFRFHVERRLEGLWVPYSYKMSQGVLIHGVPVCIQLLHTTQIQKTLPTYRLFKDQHEPPRRNRRGFHLNSTKHGDSTLLISDICKSQY